MTKKQNQALKDLARWRRWDGMSEEEIAEQLEILKNHQKDNRLPSDPASPEVLATLAAFRKEAPQPKTDWEKINEFTKKYKK